MKVNVFGVSHQGIFVGFVFFKSLNEKMKHHFSKLNEAILGIGVLGDFEVYDINGIIHVVVHSVQLQRKGYCYDLAKSDYDKTALEHEIAKQVVG